MQTLASHNQRGFRGREVAVAAGLTALCLALPTHNPSGDAWYYAACARWGHELLQPHHLLYNYGGWLWLQLVGATGPAGGQAMRWLQALNSLALGGCLLALGPLLRRAGARAAAVPAWLLAVGSSFGMLRFAVENETYVQPLLLALLASLAWARYQYLPVGREAEEGRLPAHGRAALAAARRWLLLAGLLAAAACLVHQMLVWWWLGLLLGLRPWRNRAGWAAGLAYAAPAVLVPLAYSLAAPPGGGLLGVVRFALHDYLAGGARVELGWRSLVLTPIGLVRTLLQVHGSLLPLLRHWPLLLGAVAGGCLTLGIYAVSGKRKRDAKIEVSAAGGGPVGQGKPADEFPGAPAIAPAAAPGLPTASRAIRRVHLLILGLQLAFAAQAAGNAEFMAMLPALAAVALAGGRLRAWPARRVAALGATLLAWNLAFALVPAHVLTYSDAGPALRTQVQRQPGTWVLLLDPNLLRNQLHYFSGHSAAPPRVLGLAGQSPGPFRRWLQQRLAAGDTVYTDALGGPRLLDRARLTQGDLAAQLLRGLAARRVVVVPTFFGPAYLSRLLLPADTILASQPSARASAAVNTGAAR